MSPESNDEERGTHVMPTKDRDGNQLPGFRKHEVNLVPNTFAKREMSGDKLAEADKALKELALIPMSCSLATWGRLCGAIQDGLALAVHSAQGAGDGWVMVPREPTQEMLDAARVWSGEKYGKPIGNDAATGCWKAMLSAVPTKETP